jgi:hypothetical protein
MNSWQLRKPPEDPKAHYEGDFFFLFFSLNCTLHGTVFARFLHKNGVLVQKNPTFLHKPTTFFHFFCCKISICWRPLFWGARLSRFCNILQNSATFSFLAFSLAIDLDNSILRKQCDFAIISHRMFPVSSGFAWFGNFSRLLNFASSFVALCSARQHGTAFPLLLCASPSVVWRVLIMISCRLRKFCVICANFDRIFLCKHFHKSFLRHQRCFAWLATSSLGMQILALSSFFCFSVFEGNFSVFMT